MQIPSVAIFVAVAMLCAIVFAQNAAPRETVSVSVGGKEVSVEYGRPSLKGRSFNNLTKQLPEDRIWRAGSEQVTTLKTEADIMMGGKKIPAGKYSVYIYCPESGDYSLALNSVLGQPLGKIWAAAPENLAQEPWPHFAYAKEIGDKEVARIPMKAGKAKETDLFTIAFKEAGKEALLTLSWGDKSWALEVAPVK